MLKERPYLHGDDFFTLEVKDLTVRAEQVSVADRGALPLKLTNYIIKAPHTRLLHRALAISSDFGLKLTFTQPNFSELFLNPSQSDAKARQYDLSSEIQIVLNERPSDLFFLGLTQDAFNALMRFV